MFNIVFNENCFVCIKFLSAFLRKMKRKRKPHPNVFPKLLKFFVLPIEKVFCALSDYAEMQNKANSNRALFKALLFYKRANSVREFVVKKNAYKNVSRINNINIIINPLNLKIIPNCFDLF